jgi:D-glycero-D-manno-heptose 1,7-bisphosphate phosphatase
MNSLKQPAVFLDRDGTLVEEVNYLSDVKDLRLFPFTPKAVADLTDAGYLIIVVTNQSGIGRGMFEERAMHEVHRQIQDELNGAVAGFYFCPHLPDEGCRCRKPDIAMIDAAAGDFPIDLENSWLVGDKRIDIETGHNAGLRTAMVLTGYGQEHVGELKEPSTIVAEDLGEAAARILAWKG